VRVALCSDELYPVHATVQRWLIERGHTVQTFGAIESRHETLWPLAAESAGTAVQSGGCEQGVFFCWSGTGISIAANKLRGIRAALCFDPGSARAAREWNDANVLCLSNRTLSDDMAKEILEAWFAAQPLPQASAGITVVNELDARSRP
jgi:ribose 5-phosphate isomerase B